MLKSTAALSAIVILLTAWTGVAMAAGKATVCTITINSSEEQELFKKNLNPQDFEFVELTKFGGETKGDAWFEEACSAGVKCDVLVASGHFGGNFFGTKTDYNWRIEDIEARSCQNTCDGILKRPKEVYLFGCNTLAGKNQDRRTSSEYLNVLVRDGIDHAEAERIVATRYGPFGSSFGDVMARNFEGVNMLYGFDSIGPSGVNVMKYLKSYFSKIGDFKKHLDSNDFERSRKIWIEEMRDTHRTTIEGLKKDNPAYEVRADLCELHDERKSLEDKLQLSANLLDRNFNIYLPTVAKFINDKLQGYTRGSNVWATFARVIDGLQNRSDLAEKVRKLIDGKNLTSGVKIDFLQMSNTIGWISEQDYESQLSAILLSYLKNPKTEDADFICSQAMALRTKKLIPKNIIYEYPFDSLAQIRIARCYKSHDVELGEKVLQGYLKNRKTFSRDKAFDALREIDSFSGNVDKKAPIFKEMLKISSGLNRQWLEIQILKYITGAEQIAWLQKLSANLDREQLSDVADAIDENPVQNETVSKMYFTLLFRSKANSDFGSYIKSNLIINSVPFEDWLADNLTRANRNHIPGLAQAYAQGQITVKSQKLISILIKHLGDDLAREFFSSTDSITGSIYNSPLSIEQLEELKRIYRQIPKNAFNIESYFRYILATQGTDRIPLEQDILEGTKTRWHCQSDSDTGGTQCMAKHH